MIADCKVIVVYHSSGGHTASFANSIAQGAASRAKASLIAVEEVKSEPANWALLADADAIVFGAPTYMGSVSASFKTFMEESRNVRGLWRDKLAAGFTNSAAQNGDKLSTLIQLSLFAAQHGMVWISLGQKAGNNSSVSSTSDLNRMGSFLGAMAQSNFDQDADVAPPRSDLDTGFAYGARIAEWANVVRIGKTPVADTENNGLSSVI